LIAAAGDVILAAGARFFMLAAATVRFLIAAAGEATLGFPFLIVRSGFVAVRSTGAAFFFAGVHGIRNAIFVVVFVVVVVVARIIVVVLGFGGLFPRESMCVSGRGSGTNLAFGRL
jgi:hypothetical protein